MSKRMWFSVAALAVAVGGSLSPAADAAVLAPGNPYWGVWTRLQEHRADLQSLEDVCRRVREVEETAKLANTVAKPLRPAIRYWYQWSQRTEIPGPYDIKPFTAEIGALMYALEGLEYLVKLDDALVRPLRRAVEATNRVNSSRDDRDMPELVASYDEAGQALGRVEERLSQVRSYLVDVQRLSGKSRALLAKYRLANPDTLRQMDELERLLGPMVGGMDQLLAAIGGANTYISDVLAEAPGERGSPGPAVARTGTQDQGPRGGEPAAAPSVLAPDPSREQPAPVNPVYQVPLGPGVPAEARSERPPHNRSPLLFAGGVLVLALGLGATAWVLVKMSGRGSVNTG